MPPDSPNASARITRPILKSSAAEILLYDFTREDNIWKINLPSVIAFANVVLKENSELKALGEPLYKQDSIP